MPESFDCSSLVLDFLGWILGLKIRENEGAPVEGRCAGMGLEEGL